MWLFGVVLFVLAVTSSLLSPAEAKPFTGCETAAYPPNKTREEVPLYQVNLDLPPRDRWTTLMKDKGPQVVALIDDMSELVKKVAGERIFNFLLSSLTAVTDSLPQPYKEEIEGIASATGLPVSTVTLYNIFYEAFTLCTSLVIQDQSGHLYHARNLDTGVFLGWDARNHSWTVAELLKPMAVRLRWTKNNATVFESLSFSGYVGVLTAVKKDAFTFSLNKRFALNGGFLGLLEWLLFHDHDQRWVSFLTREVMEKATSYTEAWQALSTPRLLAPVYFILGGTQPGEGCIITRDRDNFDLATLGESGEWFLVQTNYDHWRSPPFFDDRRTPARHCLSAGGVQQASPALLYNVLSTRPVLNKGTVYTALMDVRSGEVHAWRRACPDPCWPW
ncbi:acid ceramidase-like isoform X2 [Eriocheir sinensis]|uniref:acid ceramidase-like isoform X2 n=1 Tax=Eriocheir sinensis TaxID=95602 RepID=UPI0021C80CDE|nr:acid ceramidase-like isoform X2 [Eriocheir sinensis]